MLWVNQPISCKPETPGLIGRKITGSGLGLSLLLCATATAIVVVSPPGLA